MREKVLYPVIGFRNKLLKLTVLHTTRRSHAKANHGGVSFTRTSITLHELAEVGTLGDVGLVTPTVARHRHTVVGVLVLVHLTVNVTTAG